MAADNPLHADGDVNGKTGDDAGGKEGEGPPPVSKLTVTKEIVATLIALVVTVLSAWMLIMTFIAADKERQVTANDLEQQTVYQENEKLRIERQSSRKDVLLITLGLFGTVLGYYFGKIPAERHAETAEASARNAQSTAQEAVQNASEAEQQRILAELGRTRAEDLLDDAEATNENVLSLLESGNVAQQRATLGSLGQVPGATAQNVLVLEQLSALKERLARRR